MSHIFIDLERLYNKYFGQPYSVVMKTEEMASLSGDVKTQYEGKTVWLPIKFFKLDELKGEEKGVQVFGLGHNELLLPHCTIKISGKKTIIRTSLVQRRGTVKELYSVDDYVIEIKGFLINKKREFVDYEVNILKHIFESKQSICLDNVLTNIFLQKESGGRVAITSIDFPETKGEDVWIRPFSMNCESDNVFDLIRE